MAKIEVWRTIDASLDKVWKHVGAFDKPIGHIDVSVVNSGDPAGNGAGFERMITIGKRTMRERIESVVPGKSYDYMLVSGLPAKTYHGHADFLKNGDQTDVHWVGEFKPKIPGSSWLVKRGARKNMNLLIDELERTSR